MDKSETRKPSRTRLVSPRVSKVIDLVILAILTALAGVFLDKAFDFFGSLSLPAAAFVGAGIFTSVVAIFVGYSMVRKPTLSISDVHRATFKQSIAKDVKDVSRAFKPDASGPAPVVQFFYSAEHSAWVTKTDDEKEHLIGREDWRVLQNLFEKVDERIKFYDEHPIVGGPDLPKTFATLASLDDESRKLVRQAYQKIPWLTSQLMPS